jgi:hypothetical protein
MNGQITLTNGPTALNGWQLVFTLPSGQAITGGWNANYNPRTGPVTASNMPYNAQVAPNGTVSMGWQGTHTGNTANPTAATLNGTACTVG